MKTIYNVYDQVASMLALLEPKKIALIHPSQEMQQRFDLLAEKFKSQQIDPSEKDELDHFLVLERLFRLAKIKAEAQGGYE